MIESLTILGFTAGISIGLYLALTDAKMWKILLVVIPTMIVGLTLLGFFYYEWTLESDLALDIITNKDCKEIKQFILSENVLTPSHNEKLLNHYLINC